MIWFLQIAVMVGDVALFAAVVVTLHYCGIACLPLVVFAVCVWSSTGGFEAWRPSTIKRFMRNAKELGL